eukprot:gene11420-17570_t
MSFNMWAGAYAATACGLTTAGVGFGLAQVIKSHEREAAAAAKYERMSRGTFDDVGDWVDAPGEWIDKALPFPPAAAAAVTGMALYRKLFDDEVVLKDLVSRTKIPRRMLIGPAVKVSLAATFAGAAALAAASTTASHRASQLSPAEYAGVTLLATPVESSSSAPCSYLRTTSALVRQSLISSRFAVANA